MRVCREIRRVLSKNPNSVTDEQFKMVFIREDEKEEIPPEVKMANSKSAWFAVANPFSWKSKKR